MNPAIYLAIPCYVVPMILTNVIALMICLAIIIPYYLELSTNWKRLNTWFLQGRDKK